MTRGKQKIEAQKKNAEKNAKSKGSQIEHRAAALKASCPICKVLWDGGRGRSEVDVLSAPVYS